MKYHRQSFTRDSYRAANVIPDPAELGSSFICGPPRRVNKPRRGCRLCLHVEECRSFGSCDAGSRGWNVKRGFSLLSVSSPSDTRRGPRVRARCRGKVFADVPHAGDAGAINKGFGISRVCPRASDSEIRLPIFEYLSYLPAPSARASRNARRDRRTIKKNNKNKDTRSRAAII